MASAAPLLSWDIFLYGYQRTMRLLDSFHQINEMSKQNNWHIEWDIEHELMRERKVILVTDPSLIIRFASHNLIDMNGYEADEVLGKSPKIFQGPGSAPAIRNEIRQAIIKRIPFKGSIINYRKDGSAYDCFVEEYPVWDKQRNLVNFIAFERAA